MSMLRGIALSPVTKRRQRRSRTLDGLELKDGEGDVEKGEGEYASAAQRLCLKRDPG